MVNEDGAAVELKNKIPLSHSIWVWKSRGGLHKKVTTGAVKPCKPLRLSAFAPGSTKQFSKHFAFKQHI